MPEVAALAVGLRADQAAVLDLEDALAGLLPAAQVGAVEQADPAFLATRQRHVRERRRRRGRSHGHGDRLGGQRAAGNLVQRRHLQAGDQGALGGPQAQAYLARTAVLYNLQLQ